MGWTEGEGLGKDNQGAELAVGVLVTSTSNTGKSTVGIGASKDALSSVNYSGRGSDYRQALLQATQARFQQINK